MEKFAELNADFMRLLIVFHLHQLWLKKILSSSVEDEIVSDFN